MFTDRLRDRAEDDPGGSQLLLEGGDDRNRIEHRINRDAARLVDIVVGDVVISIRLRGLLYAGQNLLLFQRNAEFLVDLQQFRIDLVERPGTGLALRCSVVVQVLEIDLRVMNARPVWLIERQPAPVRFQTPLKHPVRLVLLGRDKTDNVFRQALGGLIHLDNRLESVFVLIDVDLADPVDRFLHSRHRVLHPCRGQGPTVFKPMAPPERRSLYIVRSGAVFTGPEPPRRYPEAPSLLFHAARDSPVRRAATLVSAAPKRSISAVLVASPIETRNPPSARETPIAFST